MKARTAERARQKRSRSGWGSRLRLLGPAFIAAVAYIDPGNYATNIQAGAQSGYLLLWVVLWASLLGMFVQLLSSKLGIATKSSLATQIRDHLPPWASVLYWMQAEFIAVSTDLAEFVGAALGFHLLFGMSLIAGEVCTGVASTAILLLQSRGLKPLEAVIAAMLGVVAVIYLGELALSRPDPEAMLLGALVPRFQGSDSFVLGAGILGATVMPHVIYLHSSLSQEEDGGDQHLSPRSLYHASRWDVGVAMTIAAVVNLAMLAMAAAVLHHGSGTHIDGIEQAYKTLQPALGHAAVSVFGGSLIIAGVSSTVVGTLAGQEVMQDFVHFRIPLWMRRAVTMIPSFVVVAIGLDVTKVLVFSQVVLSFGIGFAIVPLLILTSRRRTMGDLVNHRVTALIGWAAVAVVLALNLFVLLTTFGLKL